MDQDTPVKLKGVKLPFFIFLLPFLLLYPYHWFVFDSSASGRIVCLDCGDCRDFHLTVFWVFTFLPFTAICFLTSTVMFIRRARHSRVARWSLAVPGICFVSVLVLLYLTIFY
jgi:hypothetical protein